MAGETSSLTLISHAHGRERREERGIEKRALQAAVKYGVREPANPGRAGDQRWRFTHEGVVFITDVTCKHEITSWKLNDGAVNLAAADGVGGAHIVLVVDHSASMRKADVANYETRTAAVYDCLARDFVEAQLAAGACGSDVVVTLIEMSDEAHVVIDKARLDAGLAAALKARGGSYARSHGNYLPALDKALEILQDDAHNRGTLMLLFLSDGAPSDHVSRSCPHGFPVWTAAPGNLKTRRGKPMLIECSISPRQCRKSTQEAVGVDCVQKVLQIGDILGRDRVVVGTVAFGDPHLNYQVLQQMGEALPRGSFQKLELNAGGLRTAFSSLSSSLTTLRTGKELKLRANVEIRKDQGKDDEAGFVSSATSWLIYNSTGLPASEVDKYKYVLTKRDLVKTCFDAAHTGLAFFRHPFAQGVERFVYRCAEVFIPEDKLNEWYAGQARGATMRAFRGAYRLVAKEAKHTENLGRRFQAEMARVQAEAGEIARTFNRRVAGPPSMQLLFLEVSVYHCYDESYPNNEAWVLVEQELEGKFRKWNNNNGNVYTLPLAAEPPASARAGQSSVLGAICEEEEEEDDNEDEDDEATIDVNLVLDELPQCFSHFSYEHTQERTLVCDLQGVWNASDGFVLTDPVLHHISKKGSRRHKNGGTDKGAQGVLSFFKTHTCGQLCRQLGLKAPDLADLAKAANEEARLCLICLDRPRATRFGPCRHASCCEECASRLVASRERCPICRAPITDVIERGVQVAMQPTLVS